MGKPSWQTKAQEVWEKAEAARERHAEEAEAQRLATIQKKRENHRDSLAFFLDVDPLELPPLDKWEIWRGSIPGGGTAVHQWYKCNYDGFEWASAVGQNVTFDPKSYGGIIRMVRTYDGLWHHVHNHEALGKFLSSLNKEGSTCS